MGKALKYLYIFVIILSVGKVSQADTTTSRTGLVKPSIGSTSWGPKVNTNYDVIDATFGATGQPNTWTNYNVFTGSESHSGTNADGSTTTHTGTNLFTSSNSTKGTILNDNVARGYIGELIQNSISRSGVTYSSNTVKTLTIINLDPGDYDLDAQVGYSVTSGNPTSTVLHYGISTTTNTMPASSLEAAQDSNGQILGICYAKALALSSDDDITGYIHSRVSISVATNYYLVSQVSLASGSISSWGSIQARRRR